MGATGDIKRRTMLRSTAKSFRPLVGNARGIVTAKLPDLPYDFGALQPVISGEIMQVRARASNATSLCARWTSPVC